MMDVVVVQLNQETMMKKPFYPGVFYNTFAAWYKYENGVMDLVEIIDGFPKYAHFPKEIRYVPIEKTLRSVYSKDILRNVSMVDCSMSEVPVIVRMKIGPKFFMKHFDISNTGVQTLGVVLNIRL